MHEISHTSPTSIAERFTMPRTKWNKTVLEITFSHHVQVLILQQYFQFNRKTNRLHAVIVQTDVEYTPINLSSNNYDCFHLTFQMTKNCKNGNREKQPCVDEEASQTWLGQTCMTRNHARLS